MEKVRLSLDDLQVQSFSTLGQGILRGGTVRAHDAPTDLVECPTDAADCWNTNSQSCIESCRYSCGCNGTDPGDWSVDCWSDACYTDDGRCSTNYVGTIC